jgi:hypothetical protein
MLFREIFLDPARPKAIEWKLVCCKYGRDVAGRFRRRALSSKEGANEDLEGLHGTDRFRGPGNS